MKKALLITLLVGSVITAKAQELIDPFINPILLKEKAILLKQQENKGINSIQEVNLFKPKIKKPLDKLSIQGIVGVNGDFYLVILDPETGETYFLKEGDPVAPDEKIAKITEEKVVLYKYKRVNGKFVKEEVILNVDTEGLNNG